MDRERTEEQAEQPRRRARWIGIVALGLLLVGALAVILVLVNPGGVFLGDRHLAGGTGELWTTSTPEEQGMDAGRLAAMMEYVDEHDMAIDSILIVRHGHIVFEEYGPGYSPDKRHLLYSVTKSVTSMLVGIALDQGLIAGLDVPITELLPGYAPANLDTRKQQLTLEHLLTMSDGLDWNEHEFPYQDHRNIVNQMADSSDAVQFVLDRPMAHEPGGTWAYNSGASILLGAILEEATGRDLVVFAREALFDPIGIGRIYWQLTSGGHYQTQGGLHMTTRDMARLGYLMLHNGSWQGQQIVSADWVDRSTTAYYPTGGCHKYGYQWWAWPDGQSYQASGLYDQRIVILPEADMVVVITADIPGGVLDRVDGLLHTFILPTCTDLPQESPPQTYDAHGFTFEYPGRFCLVEGPIPGNLSLSDASGLVQLTSSTVPLEILLFVWHELEAGTDEWTFLEAYLEGLAETGVEVAPGQSMTGQKDSHPLALQFADLTVEGISVSSVSGAWICKESERALATTYFSAAAMTSEELLAALEGYLEGVTCH
jgi:CubicO group peptidase (beta-lactamase class C family)